MRKLGESIRARARGEEVPEGGYEGEYVRELAAELPGAADGDPDDLGRQAAELMVARIRATLERFRVEFDTWFSERTLHEAEPSPVEQHYEELEREGHVYRSEGALWLRTTASATTRTACCGARAASTPTSPPTSPTTRTSASAASTA